MSNPWCRLDRVAALSLLATAAACAPNPIVARDPLPPPPPELGYACSSVPLVLNAVATECEPVVREHRTVLRSKG